MVRKNAKRKQNGLHVSWIRLKADRHRPMSVDHWPWSNRILDQIRIFGPIGEILATYKKVIFLRGSVVLELNFRSFRLNTPWKIKLIDIWRPGYFSSLLLNHTWYLYWLGSKRLPSKSNQCLWRLIHSKIRIFDEIRNFWIFGDSISCLNSP